MVVATIGALAVAGAVGAGAAVAATAAWIKTQQKELIRRKVAKAVEETQKRNERLSDQRIDKIYEDVERYASIANTAATNPTGDVTAAYIDLVAAIKRELSGIYQLNDGIFQLVLSVRDSLHRELKIVAPKFPMPAGGTTGTIFPNTPANKPVEEVRDSVNKEMKAFVLNFYNFWRLRQDRIAEMKTARASLGLTMLYNQDFIDQVYISMGL
jgi:hypothetical protein